MDKFVDLVQSSGSKLPVFRRKSPQRINPCIENMRKGLRRSKSVNDLKFREELKPSENIVKQLPKIPMRAIPLPNVIPQRGRRRSKSVTDIKVPTFPMRIKTAQPPSASTLGKRPAEPTKLAVKPKIAKTTSKEQKDKSKPNVPKQRIPAYDYKTRFNVLSEKFDKFKTSHTNCAETVSLCDSLKFENEHMSQKLEILEPDYERVSNELNVCKNKWNVLRTEHFNLKTEHVDLKEKYSIQSNEYAVLKKEHREQALKITDLESTNQSLSKRLEEKDRERRIMHNLLQEMKGNIRVFCRVRPPLSTEDQRIMCEILYTSDKLEIKSPRTSIANGRANALVQEFTYDYVFPPNSMQFEIFEELDMLVQSALDGYHVCVFAYGQTGSGKTYTMQGTSSEDGRGMIPRSVEALFRRISDLSLSGWKYEVKVSFLEIYNEAIKDLLDPLSKLPHDIKYNDGKGATVTNLQIKLINSEPELHKLIKLAEQNRTVAVTDYNEHSSRSHAVTKIYLQGCHDKSSSALIGSINLIDLAGSENAKRSTNERMAETKHINKSLAALSNVMLALHSKDAHVPYRDSKLTYLLGSCLGGNSKTLMFVNIAPFEDCYTESINALRFASKVKDVKMNFKKNKLVTL